MHDIVHDFAQFATKNICFVIQGDAPKESESGSALRKLDI